MSADNELVKSYVAQGSDAAFRTLVSRHVDLVYATALRQVGDPGIAEEITQNVFVALSRKAPRLAGVATLAGWLHRTTILEAKGRIRTELRRRRREESAVELAALQREGASPLEAMAPLLDEGLMELGETDRMALVLRFLEDRSLRDVGSALGVGEEAARKRVSRALERLTGFFTARGFAVPAVGGCAAFLSATAKAAPAGLAVSAANGALAAGGATSTLNVLLYHTMALTKTQTAVVCLALAVVPLTWQRQAEARTAARQFEVNTQIAQRRDAISELERETDALKTASLRAQARLQNAETRLADVRSQIAGTASPSVYHWDDNAPLVRVPKKLLDSLGLNAVSNRRGQLTDQIKLALQMTEAEENAIRAVLARFVADFNAAQAKTLRVVSPTEADLGEHKADEVRIFEVSSLSENLGELRRNLFQELETTLGAGRFRFFRDALKDWMPVDDEDHGLNSGMAVFNFDHRVRFFKPTPGARNLGWELRREGSMMSLGIETDDIPEVFRPHLLDWIDIAEGQPVGETPGNK